MTDRGGPPDPLRRLGRTAALATAAVAALASVFGERPLLPSLMAAVLLILLPVLSLAKTTPDVDVRAERKAFYVSTAVLLWVMGGLAAWAMTGLEGPSLGLFAPQPLAAVLFQALALTGACLLLVYAFHLLAPRLGWWERPLVRDLMPETRSERWTYAVLSLAAGTGEELAFRAFLPAFLFPWTGSYLIAALVPCVAFGTLHAYQGGHGILRTGLMGLILAVGVAWSGSLWSTMVAHTLLDLVLGLVLQDRLIRLGPESRADVAGGK